MRRTPFVALMLGVVLLAAGVLLTAEGVAQSREQARALQRDADQVAASFGAHFERARSLDLLLAQNQGIAPSGNGDLDRDAANRALGYLEVLYPGAIGEACLIDDQGRELARVTRGEAAPPEDLSADEAENPFFAPTLALGPGEVYQAPPYGSADTDGWVISNSTWIRSPAAGRLIVHFEVALESFSAYVAPSSAARHVAVVDRGTGQVLMADDRRLPPTDVEVPFLTSRWSQAFSAIHADSGTLRVDGARARFRRIDRTAGNANDWYVVEWATARAGLVPVWVGAATTAVGCTLILLAMLLLRRQQITLRRAARLDHLTGLANRKALEEALDDAVDAARDGADGRVAVLLLDLDGFKQVNDTLGHDKGDLVLQEIARRLFANVLEHDTTARLGGDEFAVVLRRMRDVDDVSAVAHRLREALIRPIEVGGVPRFIGASIGAAVFPEHGSASADLLRNADAAMYQAKRGRQGVRIYDPGTAEGANALELAAELMTAIEHGGIDLVYQPEFSLATGELTGLEALARWTRDGHDVPPSEFVPLAERMGLIRALTYLTLRRALDQVRAWQQDGATARVSINLSGHMVTDETLPGELSMLLEERGLAPDVLVLEITETAAIGDRLAAVDVLRRIREIGIRVELDDFGSGYASFSVLQELPLDGVKIDRELIADQIAGDPRLLTATIEMARRLGLKVVAEGIEDSRALDAVRDLGCDTAQGYHLARPMSPDEVALVLRRTPDRAIS